MLIFALAGESASAQVAPGELLIYYSFPSAINGAATIAAAATEFGTYDIAIIGDGLQDGPGDPNPHPDHQNTIQIIAHPATADTVFFGYIDLGVTTDNHSLAEIQRRVDAWQLMDIDGIFLDDFGYDYGVTRNRQNAAVNYIHSKGLPVCANGWVPNDVFGSHVHANNPAGTPTSLGATDYYLSESHQVVESDWATESDWQNKANALLVYQSQLGFRILSITTTDSVGAYEEDKFFYAWYSAALYAHTATGWGEFLFSAPTSLAPYRERPAEALGAVFKTGIAKNGSLYTRTTERGTIFVNAATHAAGMIPAPDGDGDGVADAYDVCPATQSGAQVTPNGSPLGDFDCNCIVDLKDFAIMQMNFNM
jgi:hypothetical protein